MQRLQAFKFELQPNGEQARQMHRFAGSRRFVYNQALALQKERYAQGKKKLNYAALCKLLTVWRNNPRTPWLSDASAETQQQALRDLDRAYTNFFSKRASFPTFKKKGCADSFRFPRPKHSIRLDQNNSRIRLPKLGWLRYRNSRAVLGEIRNVTVSYSGDRWFVSIQTRREIEIPVHNGDAIGIDVGIARFATLSDGTHIDSIHSGKRHQQRLVKYQRRMAKKKKFSNNWKKAKAKIQKIYTCIGNTRRDFLHKSSTAISKNHAMVCVEDLQVRNMSRSAAGTVDDPGKSVRAKSALNRSILDQGWREFRRQLEYKLNWQGGILVAVPPRNTSRTCPVCRHVSADNRRTQKWFACVECGFSGHADHVGALNVLRAGHARLACEVNDAVMSSASGTLRSSLIAAVGIPGF